MTRLLVGQPGNRGSIPRKVTDFPVLRRVQNGTWGPPVILFKGKWGEGAIFSEEKLPGRQADHTRPPSAVLDDKWSYTSISPLYINGVFRQKFIFEYFIFCHTEILWFACEGTQLLFHFPKLKILTLCRSFRLNSNLCCRGYRSLIQWFQLTPWETVTLKKLRVTHIYKKFPALYEAEKFITM